MNGGLQMWTLAYALLVPTCALVNARHNHAQAPWARLALVLGALCMAYDVIMV